MIYLLRKHDIISVPSYANGIYHRTIVRYHIEDISPVPSGTDIIVKNLFCPVDKRGFLHGGAGETYRTGKACLHLQNIVVTHAAAIVTPCFVKCFYLASSATGGTRQRTLSRLRRVRSSLTHKTKKHIHKGMCFFVVYGPRKRYFWHFCV